MNRTHLIAFLVALVAIASSSSTTHARYYQSGMNVYPAVATPIPPMPTPGAVSPPMTGRFIRSQADRHSPFGAPHLRVNVYPPVPSPMAPQPVRHFSDGPSLYQCVGSNPINYLDPSGLKRYKVKTGSGLVAHRTLVVDVWDDACCNVIGYREFSMAPVLPHEGKWYYDGPLWIWVIGTSITIGSVGNVTSLSYTQLPPGVYETIDSTCTGDKKLISELQGLADRNEEIYYQSLWRNCWEWVWWKATDYKDEE